MDISFTKLRFSFYFSVLLFILINVAVLHVGCEPDLMVQMKKVQDNIFKDYDKYIRPTGNGTNTTEVYFLLFPRQLIDFDEDKALLKMDSFFVLTWIDLRLTWDSEDYNGRLRVPKSLLWTPDISIFNSHSLHVDPTQDVSVVFSSNGRLWWVPPVFMQTSCEFISQTPYPRDEVECTIVIGSWVTNGWQVNFEHSSTIHMNEFVNIHPRWELIKEKVHMFRNETYYECCPEPYISIHLVLPMRRRPVPEIEATRVPCILTMLLALSIFWLPPSSNKKLVLGGFLFVVLSILLMYVSWRTKGPLLVLFGVSFLQTTMYLVVITILLQVFVVIKIASQSGPARPPSIITHVLTGPIGKYACLKAPNSEELSLDRVQLKEESSTVESFSAIREEWKLLAEATDRTLFVLMVVVMIVVHHL